MNRIKIERILPDIFRRTCGEGNPLTAILDAMVELLNPIDQVLGKVDRYFDPQEAPLDFVPFLAGWVDLEVLLENVFEGRLLPASQFPTGASRMRALIASAAFHSKWRGTARGLTHFLEVATGLSGFEIREEVPDAKGEAQPFHFELTAPGALKPYLVLVKSIVELEKPAYVTYELKFKEIQH